MHILDRYIDDIEPRLNEILDSFTSTDSLSSIQTSLASYSWILLDSWITWRTLRFLLKDIHINESNQSKWIQTPSSYSAMNIRAAWNFDDNALDFIETQTGKSLPHLVNNTIQAKRNAIAHHSLKTTIQGTDIHEIKNIYNAFSVIFLAYEINSFIDVIIKYLINEGYSNFDVYLDSAKTKKITNDIATFSNANYILLTCTKKRHRFDLKIEKTACLARKRKRYSDIWENIINDKGNDYILWKNKGYYLEAEKFCTKMINCWMK